MDTHANPVPTEPSTTGASESAAVNELAAALARAQGAFSNPAKDRDNPYFGSRYTTLGAVIEATRGPLADNGLSLTQTIGAGAGGERSPLLRTRLLHSSGQWIASEVPLFAAGKGSQAFGSELTYMRRYAVCALLNIAPAEGDDDGNAAQAATGGAGDASSPSAQRGERRPGGDAGPTKRSPAGPPAARTPAGAQPPRPGPSIHEQRSSPGQPAAATNGAASAQELADAPQRRKDEASPPSIWSVLRPGKAPITAPDGAAWLKWWMSVASKAAAGGKTDELRALFEANAAAWDRIALGSAEAHDVVAKAAQAVRDALGD